MFLQVAGSLASLGPMGAALAEQGLGDYVSAYLPAGPTGLRLLLAHAKLYRVRRETQQLVITFYLLMGWQTQQVRVCGLVVYGNVV